MLARRGWRRRIPARRRDCSSHITFFASAEFQTIELRNLLANAFWNYHGFKREDGVPIDGLLTNTETRRADEEARPTHVQVKLNTSYAGPILLEVADGSLVPLLMGSIPEHVYHALWPNSRLITR